MSKSPVARLARSSLWCVLVAAIGLSACTKNPERERAGLMTSADRYFDQGKYREAAVEYRKILQLDPRYGPAHLKLGRSYVAIGDTQAAYRELLRAADLLPQDLTVQLQAGQFLLESRDFEGAKQRAMLVLEKDPKSIEAQILLGNSLANLNDMRGGIAQIENAIKADPERILSYANLGSMHYQSGDRAQAEAAFKRAVAANPKSVDARLALANYYWANDEMGNAERELKVALSLDPKGELVNKAAATYYLQLQKPEEGEKYLKAYAAAANDIWGQITLADYYLTTKRLKEARAILEPLAKRDDGFKSATLRLARTDYAEGRHQEAYKLVDSVLARYANDNGARLTKIMFLVDDKKVADALPLARAVVASDPGSAVYQYHLGAVLEANKDFQGAAKALSEALRLKPGTVLLQVELARVYLAQGDAKAAAQYLKDATSGAAAKIPEAHMLLAKALVAQRDYKGAEPEVAGLVATMPNSAEAQTLAGIVLFETGGSVVARRAFSRAIELDPQSIDALTGLIRLDLQENKPADARTRIEKRLAATPNDPAVLLLAGRTFAALRDTPQAEAAYRKATKADPSSLEALTGLADLFAAQNRLDDARAETEEAVRRQPKSVPALTMLGSILDAQRKRTEAQKVYERALAVDPQAVLAANNLAWNYAETGGNLDVALQLVQGAVAKAPNNPAFQDTLGWIYYKKGLNTLAIAALKQSVAGAPKVPAFQYHLAAAYAKTGQKRQARELLEQALAPGRDFEGADEARKLLQSVKG